MIVRHDSYAWLKLACLPDQMPRANLVMSNHTTLPSHAKLGTTYVWSSHTECHRLATISMRVCLTVEAWYQPASYHDSVSVVSFEVSQQVSSA